MTPQLACRYAILRFQPFAETQEFANVGVVLVCPKTGYFGYLLQTRRHKRVTDFFAELPKGSYQQAIEAFGAELERIEAAVAERTQDADALRELFTALVHPREAIIRFSEARTLLVAEPAAALKQLFEHYVGRKFATPEYLETTMARRVRELLRPLNLLAPFRAGRVGSDDGVHAQFPFVQRVDDEVRKVIKPLALQGQAPNDIYGHGDVWIQKLNRLRKAGMLPGRLLFTVARPPQTDLKRYLACGEIEQELAAFGSVAIEGDAQAVRGFALN